MERLVSSSIILSLILIVSLTISSVEGEPKQWVSTNDLDDWFTPTNWNPATVPTQSDQVFIQVKDSIAYINNPGAIANNITIGTNAGSNSSLLLLNSLQAAAVVINYGSQLGSSQVTGQVFLVDDMSNYGLLSTEGLFDTSTLIKNFGVYSSSAFTGAWGLLNSGYVLINNYFLNMASWTQYESGILDVQNCQLDIRGVDGGFFSSVYVGKSKSTFENVNYQSTADIYIGGNSTFDMTNSILNVSEPVPGRDLIFNVMQNATASFSYSFISLPGAYFFCSEDGSATFTNTTLETKKVVILSESSNLLVQDNSYISMSDYFATKDNSTFTLRNRSTLMYTQAEFFMLNHSGINVINSRMIISNDSPVLPNFSMSNSSTLVFDQQSEFILQGLFYQQNHSHANLLGGSIFIVHERYYMVDSSILTIRDSNILVNGHMLPADSALVEVFNSSVVVTGYIGFGNDSTLTASDSLITSQGYFTIGRQGGQFTNSQLLVNSDMVSTSTEKDLIFRNSAVIVAGSLLSAGVITATDKSAISIQGGSLTNNATFIGEDISINVQVGNINTVSGGLFSCHGCRITIGLGQSNGTFVTSPTSRVNLTNTVLVTNSKGSFVSDGDMYVSNDSNLSNGGEFFVNSNILLTNGAGGSNSFSNSGKLMINNNNQSVEVPLLNLEGGSIQIQQSSRLSAINQQSGNTNISSGSTIIMSNQIAMSGGEILVNTDSSVIGDVSVAGGLMVAESGSSINGDVVISGGVFSGTSNSIKGQLTIPGGQLSGSSHQIEGSVIINGGQLSGSNHSIVGNIDIVNGSMNSVNHSIMGDVLVNGGVLSSINSTITGNLNVTGGSVTATTPEEVYSRLFVNGSYTHGEQGTIEFIIDGSDSYYNNSQSTYLNVTKDIIISGGTLIIKVIENNSSPSVMNKTISLIESSSTNITGSFSKVEIITYNPETKEEKQADCKYSTQKDQSKLNLLVDPNAHCDSGSSSLSKGAIIGIVVGIVAAAAIVGVIIHFRNRIPKHLSIKYKLKQLEKSQQELGMTKP